MDDQELIENVFFKFFYSQTIAFALKLETNCDKLNTRFTITPL